MQNTRHSAIQLTLVVCASLFLAAPALAQDDGGRSETVTWAVSAPAEAAKAGSRLNLTVQGTVKPDWHVYSLKQLQDGPIPLSVRLEANPLAAAGGAVTGSKPVREHDAAFGFVTQFYAQPFTLTVPVRLKANAPAGSQTIPVSVHFQTCNGRVCQPPKTVRLSVAVNVQAAR